MATGAAADSPTGDPYLEQVAWKRNKLVHVGLAILGVGVIAAVVVGSLLLTSVLLPIMDPVNDEADLQGSNGYQRS